MCLSSMLHESIAVLSFHSAIFSLAVKLAAMVRGASLTFELDFTRKSDASSRPSA